MQKTAFCGWPAWLKRRYITKTLLVMRLTVLFLTVGFFNVYATGVSQNVSFSGLSISLDSVFSSVKKQTGFVFMYTDPILESAGPVTISVKNIPLEKFLQEIFTSQPLKYNIKGMSIFISLKTVAWVFARPAGRALARRL